MYDTMHAMPLLLQAAHMLPDTLVTKQVPAAVGTFEKITSVASGLMTIALLVLAVGLVPAAWNFRKTYKKVNEIIDRVYGDVAPLVRSASIVTEDAREIVAIVKGDVRQVQQTVAAANARLLKAVKEAEARLDEFNALIEVVQGEAETAFVNTASTVHGVRAGLAHVLDPREDFEDGDIRDGSIAGEAGANASGRPAYFPRRRGNGGGAGGIA
ncbi:MAG: DUF948 domain-containing protein [Gemmatimonadota bacterium]|nr:DUF948 domain-containing protein [Gemmatimonadota bacterium]